MTQGQRLGATSALDQYAAWTLALEVASKAGLMDEADGVVDVLAAVFEVDELVLRVDAFSAVYDAVSSDERLDLVERGLALVKTSVARVDATNGERLARLLAGPVAELDEVESSQRYSVLCRAVEMAGPAAKALQKLGKDPDHAASHRVVGDYYCFVVGDFEHGLPHLARSSDKELRGLAAEDLASPSTARSAVELADKWRAFGDERQGTTRDAAYERSEHWLQRAKSTAKGLDELMVEDRLAGLAEARRAAAEEAARAEAIAPPSEGRELVERESVLMPGNPPFVTLGSALKQFGKPGGLRGATTFAGNKDKDTGISHCGIRVERDSVLHYSVWGGNQRVVLVLEDKAPPRHTDDVVALAERIESGALGPVLHRIAGKKSNDVKLPVAFDLSQYEGQKVRIYIIDTSKRGWGFVSVSEITHRYRK